MNVIKLDKDAIIPTRTYDGDIGYDLYANHDDVILPRSSTSVRTGIIIELPMSENKETTIGAFIKSRSGLSFKHNIECGAGVIDNGYRGELIVLLYNHSNKIYTISKGDKIAQLVLFTSMTPMLIEQDNISNDTERSNNGFGSSDKNE